MTTLKKKTPRESVASPYGAAVIGFDVALRPLAGMLGGNGEKGVRRAGSDDCGTKSSVRGCQTGSRQCSLVLELA